MRIFVLMAAAVTLSLSAGFVRAETAAQPTAKAAPDASRVELAAFPQPGKLTYAITRDGSRIGSQVITFQRNGDSLMVHTSVNIKVSLLGITIYRFDHVADEEWKAGELERLSTKTYDDGDDRVVDLKAVDGKLKGTYNGQAREFPTSVIPASLWHPGTVKQTQLLDQVKARYRQITVKDVGLETISVRGQQIQAHHYSMTGQIKRELWYGSDGRLEMMQFAGKDGSKITVTLL